MIFRFRSSWRALTATAIGFAVLGLVSASQFVEDSRHASAADAAGVTKPDPVETNGPIFVNWPKPTLAIAFTGELNGYLEPCGCAGLENQLGGLKRRDSFFNQLEADGWPLIKLDLGGLERRTGEQSNIKYDYAIQSLVEMGYQAIGLGPSDLRLGPDLLLYVMSNLTGGTPIVCANVGLFGIKESVDAGITQHYRVIEAGGKRVGVTSVLGARHAATATNNPDFAYLAPVDALRTVAAKLAAERCDVQVLLVHGDPDEARDLSRRYPQFQIVATAGGAEEPPRDPEIIQGSGAVLMESGHKGMYVTMLAFFDDADPKKKNRYQRVPLDHRFPDSPAMQAKLIAYQKQLQETGLPALGLTPVAHPDGEFAGSESCADCHAAAWEKFIETPHFHATDTLVKLEPPRHFDPECLSCHVTGWNPQEYFPYATGYLGLAETPPMLQNGCENCHGPALEHVKAESGEIEVTDEQRKKLAAALHMEIIPNEGNLEGQEFQKAQVVKNCVLCHDHDNSPDFDFQKYWPSIAHPDETVGGE
jgi:hypothetical protein